MPARPRLKRTLRAEVIDGEGVYLLSEWGSHLLRGRASLGVVPLLDGQRTEDEISHALTGRVPPAEVFFALETLRRRGFVTDDESTMPLPEAALWEGLGVEPGRAAERLAAARVTVSVVGDLGAALIVEAL